MPVLCCVAVDVVVFAADVVVAAGVVIVAVT